MLPKSEQDAAIKNGHTNFCGKKFVPSVIDATNREKIININHINHINKKAIKSFLKNGSF